MRRPGGVPISESTASSKDGDVLADGNKSKERKSKPWLFLLCAWLCYIRYVSINWVDTHDPVKEDSSPVDISFIEVEPEKARELPKTSLIVEKSGLALSLEEEPSDPTTTREAMDQDATKSHEEASLQDTRATNQGVLEHEDDNDDGSQGQGLPMIGATLALSGKCSSPDYGTRIFYIKTKHTGSGKLAGILRRIGFIHNMEVVDPPKGGNTFRDETDFHRVAQGRCVDLLVAHTKRAPWLDKAFKGSLKFTSIRDPIIRAVSAYEHSLACGQHCSMCWKLISDKVRWARQCADVEDAQYDLMRGRLEDVEDIVDDYDFVLITERYLESLVVLRHILGVSLADMLFIESKEGEYDSSHVVSLSSHSQRFLDVIVSRNPFDRKLYDAANNALDDKIRIIGRGVVRREVRELQGMQELLQQTCTDRVKARDLMGGSYLATRDCLWHDQGCGNQCISRWSSLYESARNNRGA